MPPILRSRKLDPLPPPPKSPAAVTVAPITPKPPQEHNRLKSPTGSGSVVRRRSLRIASKGDSGCGDITRNIDKSGIEMLSLGFGGVSGKGEGLEDVSFPDTEPKGLQEKESGVAMDFVPGVVMGLGIGVGEGVDMEEEDKSRKRKIDDDRKGILIIDSDEDSGEISKVQDSSGRDNGAVNSSGSPRKRRRRTAPSEGLEGLTVFRDMLVFGSRPNAVTFVSVLPACASLKLLSVGKLIHGYGVKMGMDSQLSMVNALIALYGKCGNVDAARLLFDQMSVRDLISWNAVIAAYEQNNASSDAIRLFLRMQNEKMDYNYITMVSVISACTSARDLAAGRWVHEIVKNKGLETNASIQNALIDMYSKCGDIASARCVFEGLPHRNVVAWTSLIGGCASHGQADLAIQLFTRMKNEGIRPNSFTFVAILSACRHAGLVEEGKRHFESMDRDYSIVPHLEHCACVVDLLGRAGRLQEAYEFIQSMPVQPDVGIWGALLGACRVHCNVELAELVADRLFKLEPRTVTFYVLMSHIYAESGRWEDAQRLRSLMKERNLEKQPGHTLINPDTLQLCSRQ